LGKGAANGGLEDLIAYVQRFTQTLSLVGSAAKARPILWICSFNWLAMKNKAPSFKLFVSVSGNVDGIV